MKNWDKVLVRERAFPNTADMVKAMSTLCFLEGNAHLAVLPVVAFAGLFRIGELFKLQVRYVEMLADDFCLIALLWTKSRRGTETVAIHARSAVLLLRALTTNRRPKEWLFKCTHKETSEQTSKQPSKQASKQTNQH